MLKIGEIRELIRLLDETGLSELRLESEDMKLHLKKPEATQTVLAAPQTLVAPTPQVAAATPAAAAIQAPTVQENATGGPAEDENLHIITSPMVGTFYSSPSPDSPAYVETGAKVTTKTVVCIVEAMKLMNEIEAEVSGEVVDILAENGQLVEYGQPLFKIKLS